MAQLERLGSLNRNHDVAAGKESLGIGKRRSGPAIERFFSESVDRIRNRKFHSCPAYRPM
jgi:hypothetical protein